LQIEREEQKRQQQIEQARIDRLLDDAESLRQATNILRRNARSMLAYLPGDAFWAIQAQLKAGTLKHLEARYQKPSRGSGELTSLYFY
jgi:hypothetical protein